MSIYGCESYYLSWDIVRVTIRYVARTLQKCQRMRAGFPKVVIPLFKKE